MLLLGFDIGSSSVKASIIKVETGQCLASAFYPSTEMEIISIKKGWAEQDPEMWIRNLIAAVDAIRSGYKTDISEVAAIGISYQMHGLVAVDKSGKPVRNAIIWCDSRAVEIGERAFSELGKEFCLYNLLNSPGNFTASKLAWIKQNEPENFSKIHKVMLPGDYVAFRLTGEICTTASGLSEGIFWDFTKNSFSQALLNYYGIDNSVLPGIVPTFSRQGGLCSEIAKRLGMKTGTPVAYRAGDQPNNAFSLNVLQPGEIAATAGTSGVVYGVTYKKDFDPLSRVNTFLHVNHTLEDPRLGILLCINSTGILNSWAKHQFMPAGISYDEMNLLAQKVSAGSEGLLVFPFGNGAERILQNKNPGASIKGLNFNIHNRNHFLRALQEGIVFSLIYGLEIMQKMGMEPKVIKAGYTNMFLSKVFRETFASLSGASIQLYDTDGAQGAARGAGLGIGLYNNTEEAFSNLRVLKMEEPEENFILREVYAEWKTQLSRIIE